VDSDPQGRTNEERWGVKHIPLVRSPTIEKNANQAFRPVVENEHISRVAVSKMQSTFVIWREDAKLRIIELELSALFSDCLGHDLEIRPSAVRGC
jgi:hypothetical protein